MLYTCPVFNCVYEWYPFRSIYNFVRLEYKFMAMSCHNGSDMYLGAYEINDKILRSLNIKAQLGLGRKDMKSYKGLENVSVQYR
jgi:hypothetical protein